MNDIGPWAIAGMLAVTLMTSVTINVMLIRAIQKLHAQHLINLDQMTEYSKLKLQELRDYYVVLIKGR